MNSLMPGGARLVDRVLDQRAVDQSHDLFRDRLCRRQEPRSKSRHRENGLGDLLVFMLLSTLLDDHDYPAGSIRRI